MNRIIQWVLGILALGIAAIILLLSMIASPYFSAKLSGYASHKSGRDIAIGGRIETHLWSSEPRFILRGVKIGNAPWAKEEQMFTADHIEIAIRAADLLKFKVVITELLIDKPKLALARNAEGKNNWSFAQNPPVEGLKVPLPEERSEIPIIRQLRITDGELRYDDAVKRISTALNVSTMEGNETEEETLLFKGTGNYDKKPLSLEARGASIVQLRDSDSPYPFYMRAIIGDTNAEVYGRVQDPVQLAHVDVTLNISGKNAADLFPITGIALPPTPPYRLKGHLVHKKDVWAFNDFSGTMGNSDLHGDIAWHAKQTPPYLEGNFTSNLLDMRDLKGAIGAHEKPKDETRVIPDQPLDISRLLAMDADVTFRGKHIKQEQVLDDFYAKISLKNGVLTMQPLSFGIANGKINANVTIEGKKTPPGISLDVDFKRLSLTELFEPLAKRFGEENVNAGLLGGKMTLKGSGKSLRDMLASANGSIGIGMEGGRLSRLLLELAGLDIFRAVGLVLSGDKPVNIHCVVGEFQVKNGLMRTQELLFDTDVTTLRGEGDINLKNEQLALRLQVHPKDVSLLSARAPLTVKGTLKHPVPGVDAARLAARGGAAAALGALLTPVAALLAFVEPGLGEDSDCAAFLHGFETKH